MEQWCPNCANSLVEIRLGELTLRSCSSCDSRWWLRADAPAGIDDVLRSFAEAPHGRRRQHIAEGRP